ncbi:MAG: S41 family peptidase [Bacteroidia bacterium]|nr:S41 family peptidase [Bacteroidia bacterium]NNJ55986.1 S41 family peptidase [Bacteroidia bacterium]
MLKKYIVILLVSSLGLFAFKADDYFEISKNLDIFASVYKEVNTSYVDQVKPGQLIRAAIDGMLKSLDPYTNFYSEAQAEDYRYEVTGTYAGIGSTIRVVDDFVVIESPYDDYPAHKAGLIPGDRIMAIDGEDMKGKSSKEVTEYLKGNAGTSFMMTIFRQGEGELEKKITREQIKIKNVPYFGIVNDNVGYIKLTGFTPNAGNEVKDAVIELKSKGATSFVLDLRNNGGGLLHEAINIVNVFVKRGETIVTTKGKFKEDNKSYKTLNSSIDTETPLVVLINENSASASEIVSGGLQDIDRAVLIGRNSFGKGLVQTTKPLTYNTQMKITTAKYYIPSGRLIQRLDYGNKVDGQASEVADSAKHVFKTKNGREVIDGEGIQPDILVEIDKYSKVAQSLLRNNLIFKFATDFRSKNETVVEATEFDVSEELYQNFIDFLQDKEYEYTTSTETVLSKLVAQSKDDKYYDLLKDELDKLESELNATKGADLTNNKDEIKELIEYEIIKRYYFEKGKVEVSFDDDIDLDKAISVLNSSSEYNKILTN